MNKRARICFYIFLVCAFCALGIVGYFILGRYNDNVMIAPRYFTFVEVEGAESYTLMASKNKTDTPYVANCKVSKQQDVEDSNEFIFHNVVTDDEGKKLVEEVYNQTVTNINEEKNTIDCKIYNYEVTLFADDGTKELSYKCPEVEKELKDINQNTVWCLISEYFGSLFDCDGEYYIIFIAVDENGQDIENTKKEHEFDYVAVCENEFKKRDNFFMNGTWYDYVITSHDELEKFVWHSILYRENDVRFFIKTDQINKFNINDLVINALDSYPEYTGIYGNNENLYVKLEGSVATLVNFKFYLTQDHTKTYKQLQIDYPSYSEEALSHLTKKDNTFDSDYITSDNDEQNRVLNIDSSDKDEVVVYNTEQLFMVLQYGAKPVFEKNCIASIVYQNAKNILLEINNSNDLTDYEKALNIYRYVCENIIYDNVTVSYMKQKGNSLVSEFGNLSCFYLEGALYDLNNQYAVCDGLAKTFCILTNMEGVDCIKVNGDVNGVGHAWNKIKITDNIYNLDGWYSVDTTWGVSSDGKNEVLTHSYFLQLGDEIRNISFDPIRITSKADYYKVAGYEYNNKRSDFYIENNAELIDLFNYAKQSLLNSSESNFVIEFKVARNNISFSKNIPNIKLRTNINTGSYEDYFGWLEDKGINLETNKYFYEVLYLNDIILVNISKLPKWYSL